MVENTFKTHNKSMLPWLGSKSPLADYIINMIPPHKVYVEPFFGSGAVFFAKRPSSSEVINDVNDLLVNFWSVIKDDMDGFLAKFDTALHSRNIFESYKGSDWASLDRVEKAFRFYYLVRNAWNRLYRVNADGKFNAPFAGGTNSRLLTGNRNLARQFFDSRCMVATAHERLENACIECLDYKEIFKKYDDETTFYFLDPPYGTEYQYCVTFKMKEFIDELAGLKGKFVLTMNSDLKREFDGYNVIDITPNAKMFSTGCNEPYHEIAVTNFEPSTVQPSGKRQSTLF